MLTLDATGHGVDLKQQPLPEMPDELKTFFDPAPAAAQTKEAGK